MQKEINKYIWKFRPLLSKQRRLTKCDTSVSLASRCFLTFCNLCTLLPQQQLAQLQKEKSEILKNLALYYFTFVDVMEFKVGKHTHKTQNPMKSKHVTLPTLVAAGSCLRAAEHHRRLPGFLRHRKSIATFLFSSSA